ncbi:hypothetical protein HNR46_001761 [Haloferula luteola]|uniref:Uncharacterized protein n=1 Tax=Haloferula luteola TaxID=595692 RepID=A0A840V7G3_9BACT|nr:hypothetical protein [Haloferula luteola]MBB5351524.1 hypothetical protein [Haloferula luteola]
MSPYSIPISHTPRPPFVIGVTGNVDPEGYHDDHATCDASPQIIELRARIQAVFDWVRAGKGELDPMAGRFLPHARPGDGHRDTGEAACWQGLGMTHSPILILSSLAPGIDTIVVEAALDYAEQHPDAEISILAPLPFPVDVYVEASTFDTPEKKQRFLELCSRLDEGRLFEVALDNDLLRGDPEEAHDDLTAIDPCFGKPRRRLRYRAAGEYIAAHSDLLLAVFDDALDQSKADDIFEAGSATIVESKRSGLTHELLAVSNNVAWADNGPVLVLPIRRTKRLTLDPDNAAALPEPGPMHFLHPYDILASRSERPDNDPAWQKAGDERFRRVLVRQERFNRLPEDSKEESELLKMAGDEVAKVPEALAFASSLDPIACVRRRAANEASRLKKKRDSMLLNLLRLIAVAALTFGAYEHWHHHLSHPHLPEPLPWFAHDTGSRIQCGLLVVALVSLLVSGIRYYRYRISGTEENRFDYRAIGEALRVQFYWQLAGTGRSVSADYMQRQRDELDWIRYVVSSLSIPFEVARRRMLGLRKEARVVLLSSAHREWIAKQHEWFRDEAPKSERKAHHFHSRGWIFTTAGLLCMIAMLLVELSPPLADYLHHHYWKCALPGWIGGLLLFFLGKKRGHSGSPHEVEPGDAQRRTGFLRWIFGDWQTWGAALVIASLIFPIAFTLGELTTVWPDGHNWWIILTGAALLAGGLCIAWAERNFFGEEARQYRSMADLFGCADRRLERLIPRYQAADEGSAEEARLLFEIQDIFYQIGCEALNENAEWLIQHRARPLEPFMAG